MIDTAGLVTVLNSQLDLTSGTAVLSLAADSAGTWNRIRVIDSDFAPNVDEELAALVGQNLRSANGRRQMRLRIDLSGSRRFELGAAQYCRSALRNAPEIERLLQAAAAEVADRGVVVLNVHTNENGRAGEVLVSRSSGVRALDAAAVRIAGRMVFYPAFNDGIPVAVWSEIPVVFH